MGYEGLYFRAFVPKTYVVTKMNSGRGLLSGSCMRIIGRVQHRVKRHNFQTP